MNIRSFLLALTVVAVWGMNGSVGKLLAANVPPIGFLTVRFLLSSLIFLPFSHIKKEQVLPLLMTAVLVNGVSNGAYYFSFLYLDVTSYVVLTQLQIPVSIAIACFIAHEKIAPFQIAGTLTAMAGIVCILGLPTLNPTGVLTMTIGALGWSFAQLYMKKLSDVAPMTFMAYAALFSVPFLGAASLLLETGVVDAFTHAAPKTLAFLLIWPVFVMAAAMLAWQRLLVKEGINRMAPFLTLEIVFGIIGGVVFWHEKMTPHVWAGAVLTVTGVFLTNLRIKRGVS